MNCDAPPMTSTLIAITSARLQPCSAASTPNSMPNGMMTSMNGRPSRRPSQKARRLAERAIAGFLSPGACSIPRRAAGSTEIAAASGARLSLAVRLH